MSVRAHLIVSLLLVAAHATPAAADRLIVTRDGRSILVATAKQEGDDIVYVDRRTGDEGRVASSELTAVIPIARRGKEYTEAEVRKYVARIESTQMKHPRLKKQLKPIFDEWQLRLEPPPELDGEIASIVRKFKDGEPEYGSYKLAMTALSMLAVKDPAGRYDQKIQDARSGLRAGYFELLEKECTALAGKSDAQIDDFNRYRATVQRASGVDKEGAKRLEDGMEQMRTRVLESQRTRAVNEFVNAPALSTYLYSLGLFGRLQNEVAAGDAEVAMMEKHRAALRKRYRDADPERWFTDEGYPLTRSDIALSKAAKGFGSLIVFHDLELDRQCYIISTAKLRTVKFRQPTELSFRLVFSELHHDVQYGIAVRMYDQSEPREHVLPLDRLVVTDGGATVSVTDDFKKVPADFEPAVNDRTGRRHYYAYVVYQRIGDSGPEWRAISPAYGWTLTL